jgi:hypothetical protein
MLRPTVKSSVPGETELDVLTVVSSPPAPPAIAVPPPDTK